LKREPRQASLSSARLGPFRLLPRTGRLNLFVGEQTQWTMAQRKSEQVGASRPANDNQTHALGVLGSVCLADGETIAELVNEPSVRLFWC